MEVAGTAALLGVVEAGMDGLLSLGRQVFGALRASRRLPHEEPPGGCDREAARNRQNGARLTPEQVIKRAIRRGDGARHIPTGSDIAISHKMTG